jgi:hypothetical protein
MDYNPRTVQYGAVRAADLINDRAIRAALAPGAPGPWPPHEAVLLPAELGGGPQRPWSITEINSILNELRTLRALTLVADEVLVLPPITSRAFSKPGALRTDWADRVFNDITWRNPGKYDPPFDGSDLYREPRDDAEYRHLFGRYIDVAADLALLAQAEAEIASLTPAVKSGVVALPSPDSEIAVWVNAQLTDDIASLNAFDGAR